MAPQPIHPASEPEILSPRGGRASRAFTDENLDVLAHVLDDWLRVPGTSIRFGLDAVVGLVPAIGDVLGGLASCVLLFAAWFRGVPYVTLMRMSINIGIEVVVGTIPFLGDAFDIAWKANRRNYKLLVRHVEQPRRHTWKDWVFLLLLATAIFCGIRPAADRAGLGVVRAAAAPPLTCPARPKTPIRCDTIDSKSGRGAAW